MGEIFYFLVVILFMLLLMLGVFSPILVHEFSHLLAQKILQRMDKDILLIQNKSLWKQPHGVFLLSGYIGMIVYLIILIIYEAYTFTSTFKIRPFIFGAIIGSISSILAGCTEIKLKRGDLYRYKLHRDLIKKGCKCGSREFITGMEDTKCTRCSRLLIHIKHPKHAITPNHLNPNYLLSKKKNEIETSIRINADVNDVYKILIRGAPSNFQKKFKMHDYVRISDKKASWRQLGGRMIEYIVERKEPEYIKSRIEYGTNYEDHSYFLKRVGKETILQHNIKFSCTVPERIIRKRMNKNLKYIKEEIEQAKTSDNISTVIIHVSKFP